MAVVASPPSSSSLLVAAPTQEVVSLSRRASGSSSRAAAGGGGRGGGFQPPAPLETQTSGLSLASSLSVSSPPATARSALSPSSQSQSQVHNFDNDHSIGRMSTERVCNSSHVVNPPALEIQQVASDKLDILKDSMRSAKKDITTKEREIMTSYKVAVGSGIGGVGGVGGGGGVGSSNNNIMHDDLVGRFMKSNNIDGGLTPKLSCEGTNTVTLPSRIVSSIGATAAGDGVCTGGTVFLGDDSRGSGGVEDRLDPSQASFLNEIRAAFMACGEELSRHRSQVAPRWLLLRDVMNKVVQGDLRAARELWVTETDMPIPIGSESFISSCNSLHDDESQIHRLTSWNTYTTSGTYDSASLAKDYNSLKDFNLKGENLNNKTAIVRVVFDDAGNIIDPIIFEKAQTKMSAEHRNKNMITNNNNNNKNKNNDSGGGDDDNNNNHGTTTDRMQSVARKRKVKFDYPPISSLREYPRPQPDELEKMFFSEHELEQIEDDRYSTISADDVEIVAVSSSTDSDKNNNGNNKKTVVNPESPRDDELFKNYVSTPKGRKTNKRTGAANTTTGSSSGSRFTFQEASTAATDGVRQPKQQPQQNQPARRRLPPTPPLPAPSSSAAAAAASAESNNYSTSTTMTGQQRRSPWSSTTRASQQSQQQQQSHHHPPRMLKSVQIYLRERSLN